MACILLGAAFFSATDDDTRFARAFSGHLSCGLKNTFIEEMAFGDDVLLSFPLMDSLTAHPPP